ncbi:MAG TPA: DNA-3-methyladenine glycosylase [Patescibacteria group bacterium]
MFSDPILQKLVTKYPKPNFTDRSKFLFEDLIESIISQQLSIKASDTIFKRFQALFKTKSFPKPKDILEKSDEELRTAGISFQKISYLKSVAHAFVSDLVDIKKIKTMTDQEVIDSLTQIKGVGKWTAEMILIFTLNRPDVFSIGDLGLRNAIAKLYGIIDKQKMIELSETWKPHRSTASWYLWRSLENDKR